MESILLCYNRFRALQIEITIFFSSILGIILTCFGLILIPFEIDSKNHKIIFIINIPLFFLIILITVIFIIFRLKSMINDKYNLYFYFLSLGLIILCVIELFLNLINNSIIINNMYYNDYFAKNKKLKNIKKLTVIQWIQSMAIIIILMINFFSLILLSLSENLRINLQINGSYHDYTLAIKLERENAQKQSGDNYSIFTNDTSINNFSKILKEKNIKSSQINIKNQKKDESINIKINTVINVVITSYKKS